VPHRSPAVRLAGGLLLMVGLVLSIAIAASFAGAEVHALDSVAHFRLHLAVLAALVGVALLLVRRWIGALVACAGAVLGLATTLPFVLPAEPAPASGAVYTMLQMNLRYDAPDHAPAIRAVAEMRPDIVTLQEVTREWRDSFQTLEAAYPYQHYCGTYGDGGTAILSRRPFVSPGITLCRPMDGLATRTIDFNGRRVVVSALHLDWPWPRTQWREVRRLEPILPKLPAPTLLSGDFNAAPWSASVGTVATAAGARIVPGIGPSFMLAALPAVPTDLFGLPIDNILASSEIRVVEVRTLAPTSSDHLPVLLRFTIADDALDPAAPARVAESVNAN
jgi:endonuclease/exonuclease/phosphatase (EEP) superfamily protein YafD